MPVMPIKMAHVGAARFLKVSSKRTRAGLCPAASVRTAMPYRKPAIPSEIPSYNRAIQQRGLALVAKAASGSDSEPANTDPETITTNNKLNLPPEALQLVARGWATSSRSDVPVDMLALVADLPMTNDVPAFQMRAAGLRHWRDALQKGTLPRRSKIEFPLNPFRQKFMETLSTIEMPRFTRRYPALTDSVLRQMLEYTKEFEEKLQQQLAEQEKKKQKQQNEPQDSQGSCDNQNEEESTGDGSKKCDNPESDSGDGSQAQDQQANEQSQDSSGTGENDDSENQSEGGEKTSGSEENDDKMDEEMHEAAEKLAEDLAKKFEEKMAPVVKNIEDAMEHFGADLEQLLDGKKSFDLSQGVWQKRGWHEFGKLRRKLEDLRELRDLVRSLGRGGGKGPLRKAPEEVYKARSLPGVIRSALVPEQVQGLARSGSLTQMLPKEAGLMAMGWPRGKQNEEEEESLRSAASSGASVLSTVAAEECSTDDDAVEARGSHPARLLFKARLAEKALLSYERAGWLDDEPARVTHRLEMRPAGELGPIIVCLDTSGSMYGARELVAKALVLECMRGARRQSRKCYVYAFSGPGQVRALDLSEPQFGLEKLLDFLEGSFNGGTDVDRPLELALDRLRGEEWQSADILMVTDGEIPRPDQSILQEVKRLNEELGLEVHGLLVGREITSPMEDLCTQLHLFKSWSAVGEDEYGW